MEKRPAVVQEVLEKYLLVDGLPLIFDLERSSGSWAVDTKTGEKYLDFFSFFASLPLGFNHKAFSDPSVKERLLQAATHKPSNSDAYTEIYSSFVRSFAELAMPPGFRHLFFIEGGALAVENGLKTAFDWKIRKNLAAGRGCLGSQVLHFREAFHGRTGYTLSLTNTDPVKTDYFPKFQWPRVPNPKIQFPIDDRELERVSREEERCLEAVEEAFQRHRHDIAAIILEPIQGEGGDNHFRPELFRLLRKVADREEALLILDEVQTGMGLTGKFWAFEHFGVEPDILAFGKKTQVCGIMANSRVDQVPENVFVVPSRINSTWGGNLADMARCEVILKTIHRERLVDNAARMGTYLLEGLQEVARPYSPLVSNVRGRGLMCAFDLPNGSLSKECVQRAFGQKLLVLLCGERTVRLRPALTVGTQEVDTALKMLGVAFRELKGAQ